MHTCARTHTHTYSVLFIAPSVTSFAGLNLGFRTYTIDKKSYALLDHDTYYMNLIEANAVNHTNWQHEYSAKVSTHVAT